MASPMITEVIISIWPNPVPLECGVIVQDKSPGTSNIVAGSSKFTPFNLKKIYTYLKTKGRGGFPHLRYPVWLYLVENKFRLSEELAWLYFEMFDVVSDLDPTERLAVLEATLECSTQEQLGEFRKKLSVDTSRFILFLYFQSTPRLTLKSSFTTGDEWPSPEREKKYKFPENAHLAFMKTHMSEILDLLADTDSATQDKYLSVDAVRALEFVVSGSDRSNETMSLTTLASKHDVTSGYSKTQNRFSLHHFEHWLKTNLSFNPFGPYAVFLKRKEMTVACFSSEGRGRMVAAPTAPKGCRTALLRRLLNQTVAASEKSLEGCDVHIENCRRSTIYLLAPLRTVRVEKCSNCVLVLGAVESTVAVNNCDRITVITACRKINISSSSLCIFHLLTMTRPLIFPSCFHLTLAPYNTHYPQLEAHLLANGLSTRAKNYWNDPFTIGSGEDNLVIWELMPPENFRPFSIPFKMEGPTQEIPCSLSELYQNELASRRASIDKWYKLVNESQLTAEQSTKLYKSVRDCFQDWLSSNGYDKEIAALSHKDFTIAHVVPSTSILSTSS